MGEISRPPLVEYHQFKKRLSKCFIKDPVVDVPGSIPAKSWIGLCGRYFLLGAISRGILREFFPVRFELKLQLYSIRQVSGTASQKVVTIIEICKKYSKTNYVAGSFNAGADSRSGQRNNYHDQPRFTGNYR